MLSIQGADAEVHSILVTAQSIPESGPLRPVGRAICSARGMSELTGEADSFVWVAGIQLRKWQAPLAELMLQDLARKILGL